MSIAFVDRFPTLNEVERLRLVLSTYQDGSGMLAKKDGSTLPGWRDFERAVALVFNGKAQESKAIFDVVISDQNLTNVNYGLSCKMRSELDRAIRRDGRVTVEVSNSAGKFWDYLQTKGIDQSNYRQNSAEVGKGLMEVVEGWYQKISIANGGFMELSKSFYLVLSYNAAGVYQLHQFALNLPKPQSLDWSFTTKKAKQGEQQVPARRLVGSDKNGVLFEWYGESGGQLKYYPLATDALWASEQFKLEPLDTNQAYGVLIKAAGYFPELWKAATVEA